MAAAAITPAPLDSAFMCFIFPADKLNSVSFGTTGVQSLDYDTEPGGNTLAHAPRPVEFEPSTAPGCRTSFRRAAGAGTRRGCAGALRLPDARAETFRSPDQFRRRWGGSRYSSQTPRNSPSSDPAFG